MKSEDTKKFTEYYQQKKVTGTYDSQRQGSNYRQRKRKVELRLFLELLDKQEKDKVLELGCSSGFLTEHLGKVTAIDTSEGMLEIAHSKNPLAKCIPGDMFEMSFKDGSFDKVVTMRVWNHLNEEDIRKAIKEVRRVLKKEGALIFDVEERFWLRKLIAKIYQGVTRITGYRIYQYSLKEINKILKEEGFKIEKVKFFKHKVGRQFVLRARKVE